MRFRCLIAAWGVAILAVGNSFAEIPIDCQDRLEDDPYDCDAIWEDVSRSDSRVFMASEVEDSEGFYSTECVPMITEPIQIKFTEPKPDPKLVFDQENSGKRARESQKFCFKYRMLSTYEFTGKECDPDGGLFGGPGCTDTSDPSDTCYSITYPMGNVGWATLDTIPVYEYTLEVCEDVPHSPSPVLIREPRR
jgi:hypothetical protein